MGDFAFAYNHLVKATIPDVKAIGISTFSHNQLTSVTIPYSVKTIGESAFSYNQISNLLIPGIILEINPYAFVNNRIKKVRITNPNARIASNAFDQDVEILY
ncbi:MAG: leucine-rich repeat domain-containing protein [Bacteriovorax sp.]